MKKLAIVMLSVMLFLSVIPFASAASKEDIIASAKAGVTTADGVKKIPQHYIKLIEDYLNAYTIPQAKLDEAMVKLDEAKKLWGDNAYNYSDLPSNIRSQLQDSAVAFAKTVGADLSYSGKAIQVVGPDGRRFVVTAEGDNVIKQTGGEFNYTLTYITLAGIALMIVFLAAYQMKRKDVVA